MSDFESESGLFDRYFYCLTGWPDATYKHGKIWSIDDPVDSCGESETSRLRIQEGSYVLIMVLSSEEPPYKRLPWHVPFQDDFELLGREPMLGGNHKATIIFEREGAIDLSEGYIGANSVGTSFEWKLTNRKLVSGNYKITIVADIELMFEDNTGNVGATKKKDKNRNLVYYLEVVPILDENLEQKPKEESTQGETA